MATKTKDKTDVKGPVIVIDFRYWCTQWQQSGEDQRRFAQIRQQVKRAVDGQSSPLKGQILEVEQLGITLVRRKD